MGDCKSEGRKEYYFTIHSFFSFFQSLVVTTYNKDDENKKASSIRQCFYIQLRSELYFSLLSVKPLAVEIVNKNLPLVADRRYEVQCESGGSRPNAIITWYKGKRQLRRAKVNASTVCIKTTRLKRCCIDYLIFSLSINFSFIHSSTKTHASALSVDAPPFIYS
jgi:hypothetical protein